jgi:hypothetical protein
MVAAAGVDLQGHFPGNAGKLEFWRMEPATLLMVRTEI